MAWPDSGTNEVKRTIGATGRQHTTIAAWEADTDEDCTAGWTTGGLYDDPCSPVGECYDDGDFSGDVYLYEATTSEDYYRRLTAPAGQRHSGTDGDGVRTTGAATFSFLIRDKYAAVEWIIFAGSTTVKSYAPPAGYQHLLQSCVVDASSVTAFYGVEALSLCRNCVVYGATRSAFATCVLVQNCSAFGTDEAGYGVFRSCTTCTNCIGMGVPGSGKAFVSCGGDYNIGEDATAPGEHSIDSVASSIFASTSAPIDLHLASGSTDADGAGLAVSGLVYDIDGDAYTDPPDIGADQYVSAVVGGRFNIAPMAMYYRRKRA